MNSNRSYSPETPNLGQNRRFFEPCDLEIWRMTFNKANLRDLIAATSLVISNWIQIVNFSARVTVKFDGWPRTSWVKIDDFFRCVTLQFDVWPWKTKGHLFYSTSSFMHHFGAIGVLKLELESRNAQFGSNQTIFRAVWPWNLMDDLEKQ